MVCVLGGGDMSVCVARRVSGYGVLERGCSVWRGGVCGSLLTHFDRIHNFLMRVLSEPVKLVQMKHISNKFIRYACQ